ncbi:MAG: hypothetical protein AVDCRST_MAG57-1103, partial [uncultured Blastococcus sp.]
GPAHRHRSGGAARRPADLRRRGHRPLRCGARRLPRRAPHGRRRVRARRLRTGRGGGLRLAGPARRGAAGAGDRPEQPGGHRRRPDGGPPPVRLRHPVPGGLGRDGRRRARLRLRHAAGSSGERRRVLPRPADPRRGGRLRDPGVLPPGLTAGPARWTGQPAGAAAGHRSLRHGDPAGGAGI